MRTLHPSLIVFGAFAYEQYFITCIDMNFGVTISDRFKRVSEILFTNFTSPILSHKNGIMQTTALFPIFSQFYEISRKSAKLSFIILRLLSFQSFIFIFTNLTTASITSYGGYIWTTYSPSPLNPFTLSYHFASSNRATISAGKVS